MLEVGSKDPHAILQEDVDRHLTIAVPPPRIAALDELLPQFLSRNCIQDIHAKKLVVRILNDA